MPWEGGWGGGKVKEGAGVTEKNYARAAQPNSVLFLLCCGTDGGMVCTSLGATVMSIGYAPPPPPVFAWFVGKRWRRPSKYGQPCMSRRGAFCCWAYRSKGAIALFGWSDTYCREEWHTCRP